MFISYRYYCKKGKLFSFSNIYTLYEKKNKQTNSERDIFVLAGPILKVEP